MTSRVRLSLKCTCPLAGELEAAGKRERGVISVREVKGKTEEKCHGEKLEARKQFLETNPLCYNPHSR